MAGSIPKERLACQCLVFESFALKGDMTLSPVIPVPITMLVMDFVNLLIKENPRLLKFIENEFKWLTTHGRLVNNATAKSLALHAGQIDEDIYNSAYPLQPHQIWAILK